MPWNTTREDLIRRYCRPVKLDTNNWPAGDLQSYWDDAFEQLKSQLCPPFDITQFQLLNGADTHSKSGNALIAQFAALLLYKFLPGKAAAEENKIELYLFGDEEETGYITKLENGNATLFAADNLTALTRTSLLHHNRENYQATFSKTHRDSSGNLLGTTGSLDAFDLQ